MRIGLAGLGTVGATVAARLLQGAVPRAELVAVSARDAKKDRGVDLSGVDFVATPLDLVSHDKVDVVVADGAAVLADAIVRPRARVVARVRRLGGWRGRRPRALLHRRRLDEARAAVVAVVAQRAVGVGGPVAPIVAHSVLHPQ